MKKSLPVYNAFTLLEILVVMSVVVVLGGLSLFGFGGLRDTVLVNQSFADIKQDVQQVQQDSMLLQKSPEEGWVYGIGIDFNNIASDGTYSYFKWCSGFSNFGDPKTKSEIPGWDGDNPITDGNGFLPIDDEVSDCTASNGPGIAPYSGYENGKLLAGYNTYISLAKYVLFESSTGRVFLYDEYGQPVNYTSDGSFNATNQFAIVVEKNQGKLSDALVVAPLSGEITRETDANLIPPVDTEIYDSATLNDPDPVITQDPDPIVDQDPVTTPDPDPVTTPDPDPYIDQDPVVAEDPIVDHVTDPIDFRLPLDDGRTIDLWTVPY